MNTKNNRRAQETRQRIQSALLEMLEEQELDQISVSQLCRRAEVNRSTFYRHYDDVVSLMEEIEQDIGREIIEALEPQKASGEEMFSLRYLVVILQQIREHQSFYRAYLHSIHGQRWVEWGFNQRLDHVMRPLMHQLGMIDDRLIEYYFAFFKEGLLAVTRRWVDNRCPEPPEQIAEVIGNMISHPAMVIN